MQKPIQLLVAAASVMVLVAGGVYLLDRQEEQQEQQRFEEAAALVKRAETEAWVAAQKRQRAAEIAACKTALIRYDMHNETAPFVQRVQASGQTLTGETMLAEVQKCREKVEG